MPKRDFNKVALQLYGNHTSTWVTREIFLRKVNFPFSRNFLQGSTFLVVLFCLVQFMDFRTIRAQLSVSSRSPPNFLNLPENVKTKNLNALQ